MYFKSFCKKKYEKMLQLIIFSKYHLEKFLKLFFKSFYKEKYEKMLQLIIFSKYHVHTYNWLLLCLTCDFFRRSSACSSPWRTRNSKSLSISKKFYLFSKFKLIKNIYTYNMYMYIFCFKKQVSFDRQYILV